MGVRSVGALLDPFLNVRFLKIVDSDGVAMEQIGDNAEVTVARKLVGHQLAVDPNAQDVGQIEQRCVISLMSWSRSGNVGVPFSGKLHRPSLGRTTAFFRVLA